MVTTGEVILLGSGMEPTSDGGVRLNEGGFERADRFLAYYTENRPAFRASDAQVICSGGYALLGAGVERPENPGEREGILTADYLVNNGVSHRLIRVESESTSTLTNFANSIDLGYVTPSDYDADRRLGVVSHPYHLKRAVMLARKLGWAKDGLAPIATPEWDNRTREFVLRSAYRALLLGAPKDKLREREHLPERVLAKLRGQAN
jgi:uncharacterized SAM-binding protein YcdF (DUF218 family)